MTDAVDHRRRMGRRAWLAAAPGLVSLAGAASLAPSAARA
jgi:hypothetical protein